MFYVLLKNNKPIRITESASEVSNSLQTHSSDSMFVFSTLQDLANFLATFAEKKVEVCENKPTDITDEFSKVFNQIAEDPVVQQVMDTCKNFFSNVVKKGLDEILYPESKTSSKKGN